MKNPAVAGFRGGAEEGIRTPDLLITSEEFNSLDAPSEIRPLLDLRDSLEVSKLDKCPKIVQRDPKAPPETPYVRPSAGSGRRVSDRWS